MNFEMKMRDPFFDVAKLLVIFMVVFRHVMFESETLLFPIWFANATVGMNMPFFFLVSGWFAWPTIESCDWAKLGRHLKSYMWPTITTIVLFACLLPFFNGTTWKLSVVLVQSAKTWLFGPWFIWTLCECYLIVFLASAVGKSFKTTMLLTVAAFVVLMFLPHWRGIGFMNAVRAMLPLFVAGVMLRRYGLRLWERDLVGIACCAVFMCVVLLERDAREIGMSFYHADTTWRAFCNISSAATFFARPILGFLGSVGFLWLVKKVVDCLMMTTVTNRMLMFLAKGGELTLAIYLPHQWIMSRVVAAWPNIVSARSGVVLLAFVLFIGVWGLGEITVNRVSFTRKWVWGK